MYHPRFQRCGEKSGRIERLQQIMRQGRYEAGLAQIRGFGLALGGFLGFERLTQLERALLDTLLQALLRLQQLTLGLLEFSDVRIRPDIASTGHGLAPDLVDPPVQSLALRDVRAAATHAGQALLDMMGRIPRAAFAPLGVIADNLGNRPPYTHHALGILKNIQVALIPRHQPHVAVHDTDPLRDILHRALQELPAEFELL
jgi:hypothetical protein